MKKNGGRTVIINKFIKKIRKKWRGKKKGREKKEK